MYVQAPITPRAKPQQARQVAATVLATIKERGSWQQRMQAARSFSSALQTATHDTASKCYHTSCVCRHRSHRALGPSRPGSTHPHSATTKERGSWQQRMQAARRFPDLLQTATFDHHIEMLAHMCRHRSHHAPGASRLGSWQLQS